MTRESTLQILTENIGAIREFGVATIGVFGSTARNEAREGSDIDILVEYEDNKLTLDSYMDLKYFLEELFACPVDLVTKASMKPYLKERILQEVVYAA